MALLEDKTRVALVTYVTKYGLQPIQWPMSFLDWKDFGLILSGEGFLSHVGRRADSAFDEPANWALSPAGLKAFRSLKDE